MNNNFYLQQQGPPFLNFLNIQSLISIREDLCMRLVDELILN